MIYTTKNDITKINHTTDFLLELDALKRVERKSYVTKASAQITDNQDERRENSAEHSWHLAMACWSIAEQFNLDVNLEKLLKMALVHDLGEIDAGDTFLYSNNRNQAPTLEREGIVRLQSHQGNGIKDLLAIWDEQETGDSPETKLLKVVDRLLPFLLNLHSKNKTWIEFDISRSQVQQTLAFVADSFPEMHAWFSEQIAYATQQGWLKDA